MDEEVKEAMEKRMSENSEQAKEEPEVSKDAAEEIDTEKENISEEEAPNDDAKSNEATVNHQKNIKHINKSLLLQILFDQHIQILR